MKNKGFTLIELLVVVLIIGILAAIALPQYRKAVAISKYAELMQTAKTLKDSQERFYLLNQYYATSPDQLDVLFEGVTLFEGQYWKLPSGKIFGINHDGGRIFVADYSGICNNYEIPLDFSGMYDKRAFCWPASTRPCNYELGVKVCEHYGTPSGDRYYKQ